jgi:hypothetical protein
LKHCHIASVFAKKRIFILQKFTNTPTAHLTQTSITQLISFIFVENIFEKAQKNAVFLRMRAEIRKKTKIFRTQALHKH